MPSQFIPRDPWGPDLEYGEHRIIIGVPQSGKTTYAIKTVRRVHRLVCFDPGGDYDEMAGTDVVSIRKWPNDSYFAREFFRLDVLPDPEVDTGEQFVWVVRQCRRIGNLVLVADEVGDYNRGPAERVLKNLHRNGHKQGLVTILVSQRANDIPLGARATATRVDSFLQDNQDDLDSLAACYDGSSPGYAQRVAAWEPGQPPVTWQRKKLYG